MTAGGFGVPPALTPAPASGPAAEFLHGPRRRPVSLTPGSGSLRQPCRQTSTAPEKAASQGARARYARVWCDSAGAGSSWRTTIGAGRILRGSARSFGNTIYGGWCFRMAGDAGTAIEPGESRDRVLVA